MAGMEKKLNFVILEAITKIVRRVHIYETLTTLAKENSRFFQVSAILSPLFKGFPLRKYLTTRTETRCKDEFVIHSTVEIY